MEKKVEKRLNSISELIDFLKPENLVYIQPHNFPDHDAIASAFGLQYIFKQFNIPTQIVYGGLLQRGSLIQLIKDLAIDLKRVDECEMVASDKVVIVDGCKGNKNVTDLIGDEVAIIDHHMFKEVEDVEFSDIRPDYGACASVIASYFEELNLDIPKDIATAFMIAIHIDTQNFLRGISEHDLDTYHLCFSIADVQYVDKISRNNSVVKDLSKYKDLIKSIQYHGRIAFCYLPDGCGQNLLGILADFVLTLMEINFVVLCAKNDQKINFSLRSEVPEWNASSIIQEALEGIGFGGGHAEMAGGVINDISNCDMELIQKKFISIIGQLVAQ